MWWFIIWSLGTVLLGFFRRYALAMVTAAFAVVSFADWLFDSVGGGEWVTFVFISLIGVVLIWVVNITKEIPIGVFVLSVGIIVATNWSIFSGWGWLGFIALLILTGCLLAFLITGFVGRVIAVGAAAMIAVLLLCVGWNIAASDSGPPKTEGAISISTSTPTPTGTGTPTGGSCPAAFVQAPYERGPKNQFVEGGAATLLKEAGKATSKKKVNAYLKAAGTDARLLAAFASATLPEKWPDPNKVSPLLVKDGSCLSSEGQTLHAMLSGAWLAKSTKAVNKATPTNGTNSGIHKGKVVRAATPGMAPGRKGMEITLENGTIVFIDDACLNLVYQTPPKNVPPGPTDNPPKKVCPYNPSLPPDSPKCLQPKSSKAKDYVHKTGAPKAKVTDGPSDPSPVKTSQTGGGGVVDAPTRPPGSDSGIPAPGASPAPPTPRATQPPATGSQPTPSPSATTCVPPPGKTSC